MMYPSLLGVTLSAVYSMELSHMADQMLLPKDCLGEFVWAGCHPGISIVGAKGSLSKVF